MKKVLLIVLVIGVVAIGYGVYRLSGSLDSIVKAAIEKYGSEATGTTVEVAAVDVGLKDGRATVTGLVVMNPEGFDGVALGAAAVRHIAAAAAAMFRVVEIRRARISGRMSNHERVVGTDWVVSLQGENFPVKIAADRQGATVTFDDGTEHRVTSDWVPGRSLAIIGVDDARMALKVETRTEGFRIRYRGADLDVKVRTPRAAELALLMPEKLPPDTSKMLLCPMPGVVVSIAVAEGDEVQEGQALATVEAMKMENVLRAEKKAVVAKINAEAGASLAVDEVIMEFE